jgi:predicted membrane channel-forming protein YqfA (hemolysin III family)
VPGKFGFHEVWHIFVLLAALSHFIAVMALLRA